MNKRVVAFIVGVVAVLAVIVLGNLARSGATPSTNSSNQATKQPSNQFHQEGGDRQKPDCLLFADQGGVRR